MNKGFKAFTLVELIVVITILAILGTIAFISMQGYSSSARNSRRISDINNIKTSLELFILNSGVYPTPDNYETVSYGGEDLRYQGIIGDNVIKNLSKNLPEKLTDPLYEIEYTYSITNTKKEYELLSLYEGTLTYIPHPNPLLMVEGIKPGFITQANAATNITAKIIGNYNQLYVKSANYIVPTPSIINAEVNGTGMILNENNIKSQILSEGENIPNVNIGGIETQTGKLEINLSIYTGSITKESTSTGKILAIEKIQQAYSGTTLSNNGIYKYILGKISDEEKLGLAETVLLNNNFKFTTNDDGGVQVVDLNGNDEYTKLLLHNILDSSISNHTVISNGNTKLVDTTKFGQSAYFDGIGDYLTIPDSNDWDFGSGDFTIDFRKYNSIGEGGAVIGNHKDGDIANSGWLVWAADYYLQIWIINADGTTYSTYKSNTLSTANQWVHCAIVKNGTSIKGYINGEEVFSNTHTSILHNSSHNLFLGRLNRTSIGNYYEFKGKIDDLRITKGQALSPEEFYKTSPAVKDANTKLLLSMDGNEGSTIFDDLSDSNNVVTTFGNTKISGLNDTFGDSIYFDGSGDYLSIADSDDWNFGSGEFTIDGWINFQSSDLSNNLSVILSQDQDVNNRTLLYFNNNNLNFYSTEGSVVKAYYVNPWTPQTNRWYHIAVVRENTNLKFYIDGVLQTSTIATSIGNNVLPSLNSNIEIGRENLSGGLYYFNGYIDELRVSKGIARWTSNFTPLTAPYGN